MKRLVAMLLCFAMVAAFGATSAFAQTAAPTTAPDAAMAMSFANDAHKNHEDAEYVTEWAKKYEKAEAILKEWEAAILDTSKDSKAITAAYNKASQKMADIGLYFNPYYQTSAMFATYKSDCKVYAAYLKLVEAQDKNSIKYWLSSGSKMDNLELTIENTKLARAFDLENAQNAAAAAKAGAVKSQATAKALVADAIKTAQDAAATAIANAQKDAYNNLKDAYADAVEAFWGEVQLYMLDLG